MNPNFTDSIYNSLKLIHGILSNTRWHGSTHSSYPIFQIHPVFGAGFARIYAIHVQRPAHTHQPPSPSSDTNPIWTALIGGYYIFKLPK